MHYPEDHDARVAESGVAPHAARCPPRAIDLVDDVAWAAASRDQPVAPAASRARTIAALVAKLDVADATEDAELREAALRGMWEMATNAREFAAESFTPAAYDRVASALASDETSGGAHSELGREYACRVAWSLACVARARAGLLAGRDPAETKPDPDAPPTAMVGLVAAAKKAATRAPDDAFGADARDRLFDAAVGALGVLFVDKRARDAYLAVDPGFETLASACAGSSLGSDGSDDAENRRKVAAEAMSSALVRDADARRKLIKAGGFERLANLAKDSDHVGVKLAAARAMSSYASSGPRGEKALARMKKLEKALAIASDAVEWTARELLGPPAPSPQEAKEADDAFEAVARRRAALERAVAEREAADAAAKTDAETRMVAWEPPPPPEEAAELRRLNETTAAENAAKALEAEEAAARSAKIVGRDALPETLSALSFAVAGLLRASFGKKNAAAESAADNSAAAERSSGAGFAMSDSEMLKTLARVRATADAHRAGTLDERNVASALGCVSAMALDREHCARLVDAGARPSTPPPFTAEELDAQELEAFKARKAGKEYQRPTRTKPLWDPRTSAIETIAVILRDESPAGVARAAAAASLGLVLEHPAANPRGEGFHLEDQLRGAHRAHCVREGLLDDVLSSLGRGATDEGAAASLRAASSACAMFLCTAPRASRRADESAADSEKGDFAGGRGAALVSAFEREAASGPRGHVSAQFLAAALWCAARSEGGRSAILAQRPDALSALAAVATETLVPAARAEAEAAESAGSVTRARLAAPCVKALEFTLATLWLLCYGARDPELAHGEVFERSASGALWTTARCPTPSLEDARAEGASVARDEGGTTGASAFLANAIEDTPARLAVREAEARALELHATLAEVRAIEDAGEDPPVPALEAETRWLDAVRDAESAKAALAEAEAAAATAAAQTRRAIADALIAAVNLPPSPVTAVARRLAVASAWNACARSPALRRDFIRDGLFDALERCANPERYATSALTTLAASAMEGLATAYADVGDAVGGVARLAATAARMAASGAPEERERGARLLARVAGEGGRDVKADLLTRGVVPVLLALLNPRGGEGEDEGEGHGEGEGEGEAGDGFGAARRAGTSGRSGDLGGGFDAMDEAEDSDAEDSETDSVFSDAFGAFGSRAAPPRTRSLAEVLRSTELFAAAALLNLSTLPAAQLALGKRGLYALLKTNASAMSTRRHPSLGGGDATFTGGDLVAGCIQNVASHPANRTRVYTLELRAKAVERVIHGKAVPRHVGKAMRVAGRVVGAASERAVRRRSTFEKVTRRRAGPSAKGPFANDADDADEDARGASFLSGGPASLEPTSAATNENGAAEPAAEGRGDEGEDAEGADAAAKAAAGPGDDDASERSDAERGEGDDDAPLSMGDFELVDVRGAGADASADADARDSDWLARTASTPDERAAEGLALLSLSMRKPLRNLWARPETRPDDTVTDPSWTANRGRTRVVLNAGSRGAPEGAARWRPPVREYVDEGKPSAGAETTTPSSRRKDASTFVSRTTRRLLAADRPGSVRGRLEAKAREVAAATALGAPAAFGGAGAEDGLMGSAAAPDPAAPVARVAAAATEASAADERAAGSLRDDASERRPSPGPNDADAPSPKDDSADASSSDSPSPPLKVVLHPSGPRHVVRFVGDLSKDPDPSRRNASLAMFEHVPGARAHLDADIPAYRLPNGKHAFYYHSNGNLVSEVSVTPERLPPRPVALRSAFQDALPSCGATLRAIASGAFGGGGGGGRAFPFVPRLCPLPDAHTLRVADPGEVARRDAFGDCPRLVRVGVTEVVRRRVMEEHSVVPAVFREPYAVSKSVFAPRAKTADSRDYFDRTPMFHKMFDHDWCLCVKKQNFAKFVADSPGAGTGEERTERVKAVLREYYDEMEGIFKYYSVAGNGDEMTMQFNEFSDFVTDCDLPDPDSKYCKRAHVDTLFKAANYEDKATDKEAALVNSLNDDTALTRFEFVEICVRVADAKFIKSAQSETLADAIEALFERFIVPNVAPEALVDANEFREKRLYTEEVEDAFVGVKEEAKKFTPDGMRTHAKGKTWLALENLYKAYTMPIGGRTMTTRKHMTMEQWIEMLTTLDLISDDGNEFTMREARLAFVHGQMRVVREFADEEKFVTLNFTDWLEALARVAEFFPLPPLDELRMRGFDSGVEFLDSLKKKDAEKEKADADAEVREAQAEAAAGATGEKNQPATRLKWPHRASRAFAAPKTRPLAQKLDDFLDYLFRCVWRAQGRADDDYALDKAAAEFGKMETRRKKM